MRPFRIEGAFGSALSVLLKFWHLGCWGDIWFQTLRWDVSPVSLFFG